MLDSEILARRRSLAASLPQPIITLSAAAQ
jgi:hypothetical protein